ncbi:hypothetical protein [Natrinema pallidum]|uniref:Uncharacterized protein n=2 Tax=Natrinema pallidum TaxID=69527 RepID=L9Z381_9EURY|nr:hypothetical protein [Natrinema pallidum]ELY80157.1 hypothetical protein C487_05249 [Natrinema pallidum DSM 3751]QCW02356.1 hypothetical protein FGF80_03515 [Natrinema pallidum]
MATVETVLSSIFSTIPELHSGQLGLLSGVLVGVLYWHGYRRPALALLTAFYLLALGIVPGATRGLLVVQSNPWYFCSFLLIVSLSAIGATAVRARVTRSSRRRTRRADGKPSDW